MICMRASPSECMHRQPTQGRARSLCACSSMLHGAMRQAEESKLGGGRYGDRGSAGQYITRGGGGGAQR